MPTNNQPGSSQQDNDEAVVHDEDKWTVVKRKKSRDTARVSKRLLKLRAPRHVWENMSSSEFSCSSQSEVDMMQHQLVSQHQKSSRAHLPL